MSLLATLAKPFAPPIHTIRHYSAAKFRRDLLAGLVGAVVALPQAIAYALIADVPPIYGIYSVIIQSILGALLSSSEHLTTGPTNTQSLLIAATVHRLVPGADADRYLQLVFALCALKGLIQLGFAAAQMGLMVRYVSRAVIAGVAGGAGVLIIVGQFPAFVGVRNLSAGAAGGWLPVLAPLRDLLSQIGDWNMRAAIIGAGALVIVAGLRAIHKLLPGAMVAVIAGAACVWAMGWVDQVPVIGDAVREWPAMAIPSLDFPVVEGLFSGALALAVLGMLESVAIAKTIATHTGTRIAANQEFFAQGLTNLVSSFFQCIPGSGSFTRSALGWSAGAQTRLANVFSGLFVLVLLILLGRHAEFVPKAALAGILLVIAIGLIEVRYFLRLARTSRSDTLVAASTFTATLVAPLQYAIFIGVLLNIALYLRRAGRLHVAEMVPTVAGPYLEHPLTDRSGHKRVMFLQVEGDLFFGMADELEDRLIGLIRSGVRIVILRLKRANSVDATVLHALEQFATELQRRGGHLILCGIRPELMQVLKGYGLTRVIGEGNIFEASFGVFASAKAAIKRAKQLAGTSIDTTALDAHLDSEVVDYAI